MPIFMAVGAVHFAVNAERVRVATRRIQHGRVSWLIGRRKQQYCPTGLFRSICGNVFKSF
jgi:hypothetical protein